MKKLDVEIELIKCKIREEDLQEDFKEKLENKLNNVCETKEYTTIEDIKNKKSFKNRPYYCYKAAAVFICFVMFSSCAFAGGVGDWLKDMFSNVSEEMEVAYENGDIKEVNTEYQTYDGVSVKVDYISLKDEQLYVVFNVKAEESNAITMKDIIINNEVGQEIFDYENSDKYEYFIKRKSISANNELIFITALKKQGSFNKSEELEINIKNIQSRNKENIYEHSGNWGFKINVNN